MAHNTIAVPVLSDETKVKIASLIDINSHVANLLSLLKTKISDDSETLIHCARRYINDEFQILMKLQGEKQ